MTGDTPTHPGAGALTGLKVWDASWVGVGPLTTRYLADHGATVVRTETSRNPDMLRVLGPFRDDRPGLNRSQFFADFNPSKFSLGVDLAHDRGQEIGRRLAGWADVVVEAFSPGVMDRFGLSYVKLSEINPTLIMLSTCMNGQTGPRRSFAGFGGLMSAIAGFSETTGWPDRNPGSPFGAYTDFVCQRLCATALLAAIDYRHRTGRGQYIDLAQYEGSLQFLAPWLLDFEINGRCLRRDGNRSPHAAPHGIYRCADEDGGDRWVAIAVETDDEWLAFVEIMGSPAWATGHNLRTLAGRKTDEDTLDEHISDWTRTRSRADVFGRLQPRIAAAPVQDAVDLHQDPQIEHRKYLRELDHTEMGLTLYEGSQVEMTLTNPILSKAAPCLGEDTRFVLEDLLGFGPRQVDELIRSGAAETYSG